MSNPVRFPARRKRGAQVVSGMGLREAGLTGAAAVQALFITFMWEGADFGMRVILAACVAALLLFIAHYRNPTNRMTLEQWFLVLAKRFVDQRRQTLVATHQTGRMSGRMSGRAPGRAHAASTIPSPARPKPALPTKVKAQPAAKTGRPDDVTGSDALEVSWTALIALFWLLMATGVVLVFARTGQLTQIAGRLAQMWRLS
jgi:hypothetical protein